jgi:hypothetical protein
MATKTYAPVDSVATAYLDGWNTGATWDRVRCRWVPGGPIVFGPLPGDDPAWVAVCRAMREANEAWLRGWHDGIAFQSMNE